MIPISIKFQAYIPKNLGKPLLSYFEKDKRLNYLTNKNAFLKKLRDVDKESKGRYWIPEPYSYSYYFSTDDTYIHNHHTEHTMRLGFHLNIDPNKIGKYRPSDSFLIHKSHNINGEAKYNNQQHSGLSHRVEVYIQKKIYPDDMAKLSHRVYTGVCNLLEPKRSPEKDLTITPPKNYFSKIGNFPATYFKISASGGYPYTPPGLTPKIDFKVEVRIINARNCIYIDIEGEHDMFPAYELLINEQVAYPYDPIKHGEKGPGRNLCKSKYFSAHKLIWKQKR